MTNEHRRSELIRAAKAAALGATVGAILMVLSRRRRPR
jgi:hypothetical protein